MRLNLFDLMVFISLCCGIVHVNAMCLFYIGGVYVSAATEIANSKALEKLFVRCFMQYKNEPTKLPHSSRQKQEEIKPYRRSFRTIQMAIQMKSAIIHVDYICWVTVYWLLASPLAHHVLFSIFLLTPIKSPLFSPSKWTRMISSTCLRS